MWMVIIALCIGNIASASASSGRRGSRQSDDGSDAIKKSNGCNSGITVLGVFFDGQKFECDVTSNRQATSKEPEVFLPTADLEKKYTVLMVDPDAPGHSLEHLNFWLHWAVTDVEGGHLRDGSVEGHTLMEYAGPSPPSGTHRYFIVVFETDRTAKLESKSRGHFSLMKFAEVNEISSPDGIFQFKVPAS